ncbi:MAG: hypothetical protein ACPGU1_08190 [Myxococcota bacterium]
MTFPVRLTCSLLVAALSMAGCDSAGSDSGVDEVDPVVAARAGDLSLTQAIEVETETLVADLDEETFSDFCAIALSTLTRMGSLRDAPKYSCTGEGLYARFSPGADNELATCETARDACLESSEPHSPSPPVTCDEASLQQADTCLITIAQYEACITGLDQIFAMIDTTLSCDITLEQALEFQSLYNSPSPEVCDPVAEGCPLLADVLP